jgi:nucleotide-binding universal stress UspA family protein
MYHKILLPTDGSEGAEAALEHALEIAEKYGAELHILYVADVRVDSTTDMWTNMLGQLEEMGKEATEEIAEKVEEAGVETVTEVSRGIPHEEINSYVDENDIDLIIMGTHGRTGIDRILLGSVAEKVIRTSEKPVLTVGRED